MEINNLMYRNGEIYTGYKIRNKHRTKNNLEVS